jgi:hypothetical protein
VAAALVLVLVAWLARGRGERRPEPELAGRSGPAADLTTASRSVAEEGHRFALLVGVKDYDHTRLPNLKHTENDVEDLAAILGAAGSGFQQVTLLTGARGKDQPLRRPTARNIQTALKELVRGRTRHDLVLVALAGHGVQLTVKGSDGKEREEGFFCPCDAQLNDLSSLLGLNALFRELDECGAGVKLLLVDACRNDPREARNLDADTVPRPPRGIAALFSCSAGERAFETGKLGKGHGVFFHFVLEGLKGKAKNSAGAVTWSRLAEYVTDQVADEVPRIIGGGARQTPHKVENLRGKSPILLGASPRPVLVKKDAERKPPRSAAPPPKPPDKGPPERPPPREAPDKRPAERPSERRGSPSRARVVLGRYEAPAGARQPSLLVSRPAGKDEGFKPVPAGGQVFSADSLVSLPGFQSEVRLESGVGVVLHGHLREYSRHQEQSLLMESGLVLHKNPAFDADLTLDRGRIYVSNRKSTGAVKVRLRFDKEVWDLTLSEPGSEAMLELFRTYTYTPEINWKAGEEPFTRVFFCLTRGEAELRLNTSLVHGLKAPPGECGLGWDNLTTGVRGPQRMKEVPEIWHKDPPGNELAAKMTVALKDLTVRLAGKKRLGVVLREGLEQENLQSRLLALYCLKAVDDVERLLEALGDDEPTHTTDRDTAVFALQRWLARGPGQANLLYDKKKLTGYLIDLKYRKADAEKVLDLLYDLPPSGWRRPETFEYLANALESPRVAIAELAFWHLRRLAGKVKLPLFNAAAPLEDRRKAADEVRKLIASGKLPPPAPKAEPGKTSTPLERRPVASAAAPPTEVYSGRALNTLFRRITSSGKRLSAGPPIPLDEETLKHINVKDPTTRGNVGLLRNAGKLAWPVSLLESPFDKERTRLTRNIKSAVQALKDRNPLERSLLNDLQADLKALTNKLTDSVADLSPAQYIQAKRYLNQVADAVLALSDPKVGKYFDGTWAARGKTVAELLDYLRKEGLQFAPATSGDEAAYMALYNALRSFDGVGSGRKPPKGP